MQVCSQGIIDQFETIASKEIYILYDTTLRCFILFAWMSYMVLFYPCASCSFKGSNNRYLIYFTFVKSVVINKYFSQPISYNKMPQKRIILAQFLAKIAMMPIL